MVFRYLQNEAVLISIPRYPVFLVYRSTLVGRSEFGMLVGGKLTNTHLHNSTQLQMLCTCLFTKLHGRQYMFNNNFTVSSRQQQKVHITFHSCLIRIQSNNYVILSLRK